ncbi:cytochrome b5 reductase 4 [Microplitis demolitor]|uniref:cytochrome b5 reductase 4 n=1 Tax=Microplitis demolitor TaxID=69319 RepID=UPI0004CCD4DB|nr:cytochrome b5 reductase 4 [Microplitis demolitor]XP_008547726.1 cytochrome b5 reductase 4 [Microplitis demolitor]XP_053596681.1 cytochrome b5 reductase 4 [Microplitis demolitor]
MDSSKNTKLKNDPIVKGNSLATTANDHKFSGEVQKAALSISPTTLLAKSSVLLPTGIARVKQYSEKKADVLKGSATPSSSYSSATGNPRNKTALAPGHSLMDWIRLGSSNIDLTGVGGISQIVTMTELTKHNQKNDAWIAIRGVVFNVTRYMDFHPGGVEELMKGVGKDATKLFENVHAWVNYQSILQKCIVGKLSKEGITDLRNVAFDCDKQSTKKCSLTDDKLVKSSLGIQSDWKQTTNTISFVYKISKDQSFPGFQLIRINEKEFNIQIHTLDSITKHEYDLCNKVQWPPVWNKNFETGEISFCFSKIIGGLWKSYGSRVTVSNTKRFEKDYRSWEVVSNTVLCEAVHLLVLKSNNYMEIMVTGRHVEAKMNVMDTEITRCYTPVPLFLHSENILSEHKPDYLYLIIKRYNNGNLSPSITALQQGQSLILSNGLGTFEVESFDKYSTIHILAAGTGITPMLSIIHRALQRRNIVAINVLNFNKNEKNIFYSPQLKEISTDIRLTVTDILSQADDSWHGKRGIVSEVLLKELIGNPMALSCIFICGPTVFMNVANEILLKFGWETSQIYDFKG